MHSATITSQDIFSLQQEIKQLDIDIMANYYCGLEWFVHDIHNLKVKEEQAITSCIPQAKPLHLPAIHNYY